MSATFERTTAHLERGAAHRTLFWGAQCSVRTPDRCVDLTIGLDGRGRPIESSDLFPGFCGIARPLLVLAVAKAIEAGEIRFETRIGDRLPEAQAPLADMTIERILACAAGFRALSASDGALTPPERRLEVALSVEIETTLVAGQMYEEFVGPTLLEAMLERLHDRPYPQVVNDTVLGPLGLQRTFTVRPPNGPLAEAVVATNVDLKGPAPLPILIDDVAWIQHERHPGFNAYGTASDLADLYTALAGCQLAHGELLSPGVALRLTEAIPALRGGTAPFTRGFATNASGREFPGLSANAFGKHGAATTGVHDPDIGLSLGVHFVGDVGTELGLRVRLAGLVAAVLDDLGVEL